MAAAFLYLRTRMYAAKKNASVAALPARLAGPQRLGIPGQFRHGPEAAGEAVEQLLVELIAGGGEFVIAPQPLLPRPHQPGLPQVCQVPRDLRLGRADDADQ